jgi:hypothetical protein
MQDELVVDGAQLLSIHDAAEYAPSYAHGELSDLGADLSCPRSWYGRAEAFFLDREGDDGVPLSDAVVRDDFGYELAGRFTFGKMRDCLDGWEFSFAGPFQWTESGQAAGSSLNSNLMSIDGVAVSAFNGASFQREVYESRLNSFEVSRKWWGWDVISISLGTRYLNLNEKVNFDSIGAGGEIGQFRVRTDNDLVGLQGGLELILPMGPRLSFGSKLKLGPYANFADGQIGLSNAGTVQFLNGEDDVELSFLGELGYYLNYRITPRVSLRAGYEVWYLYGVALASDQAIVPLSINTGRMLKHREDVFYHGGTAGLQVIW